MSDDTIFEVALAKTDRTERAAYLDSVCSTDANRRERIEERLRSHTANDSSRPVPLEPGTDAGTGGPATIPQAHPPSWVREGVLGFLKPPTTPDGLGRLAHFEVEEKLGEGAFGTVLKAWDERLHRHVAIKMLAPELASDGGARMRFLREGRAAAAVTDEHVVEVYEVSDDTEPIPYLVMEYVAGQTLQHKIDRVGPMSADEVLRLGVQVARGLAAAHARGLIHRDVKPANILLADATERVKIADFGLARTADDASTSQRGVVAGTPIYMAPEQARGEPLDCRADLFSLGSVLYAMCTGRPPFPAESKFAVLLRVAQDDPQPIRELAPDAPDWLCAVVAKLHAKSPDNRFQSATEVADLLAKYLAEFQGRGSVTPEPTLGPPRRHRKRVAFATAALFLLALSGVGVYALTRPPLPPAVEGGSGGPPADGAAESGVWVQLFNGKDLSGWEARPGAEVRWTVGNGELVGFGPEGDLISARGDYRDYHLRAEVFAPDRSIGGVAVRAAAAAADEAPLIVVRGERDEWNTGSVYGRAAATVALSKPGEWFTLEVIVRGARVTTRVNGTPAAEWDDLPWAEAGGHIALRYYGPGAPAVRFRKIEIRELPPDPTAAADEYVLSPELRGAIERLPRRVAVTAVLRNDGSAEVRYLKRFLRACQAAGSGRLPVRILDVTVNRAAVMKLSGDHPQLRGLNEGIVLEQDRGVRVTPVADLFEQSKDELVFRGEERLYAELAFLLKYPTKPVVYFTQSAGELSVAPNAPHPDPRKAAGQLRKYLERTGFDVRPLVFGESEPKVPADAAAVVVADPAVPLTPAHAAAVRAYMTEPRGGEKGKLVVLAGGRAGPDGKVAPTGLEELLTGFNVSVDRRQIVSLEDHTRRLDWHVTAALITRDASKHPVAARTWRAAFVGTNWRPVESIPKPAPGYDVVTLLVTLPDRVSWLEEQRTQPSVKMIQDEFVKKEVQDAKRLSKEPRSVAVAVSDAGAGRLVVIGNGGFVSDDHVRQGDQEQSAFELVGDSLDWLLRPTRGGGPPPRVVSFGKR